MTKAVTITCEGVDGMTLEKTAELIATRAKVLGETTKDAVISTAINVLVSLRASTRSAKRNRRLRPRVSEMAGVWPSWTSHGPRRVLRAGGPRGAEWKPADTRVRWLTRGTKGQVLHAYQVTPENQAVRPYIVVAATQKDAEAFERKAAAHRIDRFGSLAKWALGVAMNKLSTRNVNDGVSDEARLAGSKLARVSVFGSGVASGSFGVGVLDSLDYAVGALKGGDADVSAAIQKAANKTAGLVRRHMADLGAASLAKQNPVPTPFPNVLKKR